MALILLFLAQQRSRLDGVVLQLPSTVSGQKTEAATYILSISEVAEVGPPAIKLFMRWEYLFKC